MKTADTNVLPGRYESVDDEAYDDLFAPFSGAAVFHRSGQQPIEGEREFERFYHEERPIEEGSHEVDAIDADGDTAVAGGRGSQVLYGREVGFGFADPHRFDDGGSVAKRVTDADRGPVR
ncbi:nuclear transport factor 2 family protein [Natronorarus salvus]|uniref:nuclear transport factor 2 family protein n=1 Tax=Natronorarus salvus TaxID=3117733 RepID=UPI002F262808